MAIPYEVASTYTLMVVVKCTSALAVTLTLSLTTSLWVELNPTVEPKPLPCPILAAVTVVERGANSGDEKEDAALPPWLDCGSARLGRGAAAVCTIGRAEKGTARTREGRRVIVGAFKTFCCTAIHVSGF